MRDFLRFVRSSFDRWGFAVLFYTLGIIYWWVSNADFTLQHFDGRMIGEATLKGVDVAVRSELFYSSILLFITSFAGGAALLYALSFYTTAIRSTELRIINFSSLAGIILLLLHVMIQPYNHTLNFIFYLHVFALFGFVIKQIVLRMELRKILNHHIFILSVLAGISTWFLLKEISILFEFGWRLPMLRTTFIAAIILLFIIAYMFRGRYFNSTERTLRYAFFVLIPLACLPLLTFVKNELYLFLNDKQIFFFTPRKIYLIGLVFLTGWTLYRIRRSRVALDLIPVERPIKMLGKYYFPLYVIGLALFAYYQPFRQPTAEMFELSNRYLPLMEMTHFGTFPLVEKFNTHLLGEIFSGLIFTFLNGYEGHGFLVYDFIYPLIMVVMAYYLTYRITGNPYVALFIALFFPLLDVLFPEYFAVALLGVFVLALMINEKPSLKNYLLFFFSALFFCIWRLDVGLAVIIAYAIVLLTYRLQEKMFRFNRSYFWKAFGSLAAFLVIAGIYFITIEDVKIFDRLMVILQYASVSQSYGYAEMGNMEMSTFKVQHYVFPVLTLMLAGYILFNFKKLNKNRRLRFASISLLFLIAFYIVNFQRGLVRHNFREGYDVFLSSFVFLILSASSYLLFFNRSQMYKFIMFNLIAVVAILNYKYPELKEAPNLFGQVYAKTQDFPNVIPKKEKMARVPESAEFREKVYQPFQTLVDSNLSAQKTFMDFSNRPMLYHYVKKPVPSYFYLNPHALHRDKIQEDFLDGLKDYDVPMAVFSTHPKEFWDEVDGVPNAVRHYKIAEYLYQNYEPFALVQNLSVWQKKGESLDRLHFPKDTISTKMETFELRKLPAIWAQFDQKSKEAKVLHQLNQKAEVLPHGLWLSWGLPQDIDKSSGNYIRLNLKAENTDPFSLRLAYGTEYNAHGAFTFEVPPADGSQEFLVRISTQYNWYAKRNFWLSVESKAAQDQQVVIEKVEVLKGD